MLGAVTAILTKTPVTAAKVSTLPAAVRADVTRVLSC
jgi:hypothetical protein